MRLQETRSYTDFHNPMRLTVGQNALFYLIFVVNSLFSPETLPTSMFCLRILLKVDSFAWESYWRSGVYSFSFHYSASQSSIGSLCLDRSYVFCTHCAVVTSFITPLENDVNFNTNSICMSYLQNSSKLNIWAPCHKFPSRCVLKFYTRLTNDKTGYFNRDSNKINVFPYHFDARNWMCGKI